MKISPCYLQNLKESRINNILKSFSISLVKAKICKDLEIKSIWQKTFKNDKIFRQFRKME
jgi:hypothetical protein